MERTLVILKPSAVQRGLIGEVIARFEKKGLKLVAIKMIRLTDEILAEHYESVLGKQALCDIENDTQLRWDMIENGGN